MTRDDFEAITALDAVKNGNVKIELHCLGFKIIGSRGQSLISYLEAEQARFPLVIFEHAIDQAMHGIKTRR